MAEHEQEEEKGEGKEEGGGEGQHVGLLGAITEQRMIEHMQSLDKFYSHYDNQQYAAVVEMEHEVVQASVLEIAREMREDPMVMRIAGGIYGYLGISLDSMGQREKAMKMHEQAHIIAKEVGDVDHVATDVAEVAAQNAVEGK